MFCSGIIAYNQDDGEGHNTYSNCALEASRTIVQTRDGGGNDAETSMKREKKDKDTLQ